MVCLMLVADFRSVGQSIGQSRLAMFLLRRSHIGETVHTLWPDSEKQWAAQHGVNLLLAGDEE